MLTQKNKLFLIFFLIFSLNACEQAPAKRVYTEIVITPASSITENNQAAPLSSDEMNLSGQTQEMQRLLAASVADLPLTWKTPRGWLEEKGQGMRLVTFTSQEQPFVICTITSLKGGAGGIESNISRWLGQLNIMLDNNQMAALFKEQEVFESAGGLKGVLIDVASLQRNLQSNESTESMISAIIETEGTTIFVKMTGPLKAVSNNKIKFKELCLSLILKNGQ